MAIIPKKQHYESIVSKFGEYLKMTFIPRKIHKRISEVIKRGKSVLLLGPRQTGKTTIIKKFNPTLLINLANPIMRIDFEKDPSRLLREVEVLFENNQKIPLVVIDEIQKIPMLFDVVQFLIDEKKAQFILTGSSARKLRRDGHTNLLPGRVILLRMDPLTIDEILQPLPPIEDLLLYGSLPEILTEKDQTNREENLFSYVTTYLEEEIRAEALVRKMGAFSNFLKIAALESGLISNFHKLSQDVAVSHPTINEYYQILVDCLIAERIEALSKSRTRKKLIKSPKYLFYDLGVRRVTAGESVNIPDKYMGALFEQWVGLELLRLQRVHPEKSTLMYWRDSNGPEIDWIIERQNQYIPIEVKWTENPVPNDARHVSLFLKEYTNTKNGYVVCRAPRKQKLAERVWALPWQKANEILSEF